MGGGIAASAFLGLQASGVSIVGHIPSGLPAFVPPDLALLEPLWPAAVAMALMSFTETIAAGRAFTAPGEPRPDPNQELVATGAANLLGGLFGAMPGGGGTSQTAVNRKAGARTQVASLVTSAVTLATLLFLAPVMGLIPQATLAAVVIATSVGLIHLADFRAIRRFRTREFRWALVACVGVVVLGTLKGILAAVILSMLSLLHMANNPPIYVLRRKRGTDVFRPVSAEHPEDESFPGLLILRTEGRVYFGNAQNIGDGLWPLVREARPEGAAAGLRGNPRLRVHGAQDAGRGGGEAARGGSRAMAGRAQRRIAGAGPRPCRWARSSAASGCSSRWSGRSMPTSSATPSSAIRPLAAVPS